MLSIIICSNNPELFNQVQKNIQQTIGINYEILYFDNRKINKGICSVYNELAAKSKFSYLCFLHEDILIQTKDWGIKLIEIFSTDDKIGLIGIAGCKYKSQYFSGWFSGLKELDCANYIHQYKNGSEFVHLSPSDSDGLEEVVCIDGVFMCCTKEAWSKNQFNEKLLTGFHFYDIDFSLKIAHSYKVVVTYHLQLTHITTGGDYSSNWINIAIKYHQHKRDELPFSKITVDNSFVDKSVIKTTMDFLKMYHISFRNKIKWVTLQELYLSPAYYYSILKFLFYTPLRLKFIHNLFKTK